MGWVQPLVEFQFWYSDKRGLIRERRTPGRHFFPEVWRDGRWHRGSSSVMDAITGMGEDAYSCGECAQQLDEQLALEYAAQHQIDLYADNAKDSHSARRWEMPDWRAAIERFANTRH